MLFPFGIIPADKPKTLNLHESSPARRGDRFRATENVQLAKHASEVRLDCGFADVEVRADFFIAFAASQKCEDLQFTTGKRFAADACRQLGHERRGNGGLA